MTFNVIDKLRAGTPQQRGDLLKDMYEKNMSFFNTNYPVINQFLSRNKCPYRIDMTETFLNIVHDEKNELAHPPQLDKFAEMLGGWIHEGWQDLFNLRIIFPNDTDGVHNKAATSLIQKMDKRFPAHQALWDNAKLNLKVLSDGKRFSPPIVFLGIFHGLHIAHLFKTTEFTNALFLEPDASRFEVSCYFLDYEEVAKRIGTLHIYVGEEPIGRHFARFYDDFLITPQMWSRCLPAYPSEKMPLFLETVKSLQSTRTDTVFSYDLHVKGLQNACNNINRKMPLLTKSPTLSKKSRIAVVASGPSLAKDIGWLKKNKEKVLIFAVHSSVRTLRKHDIIPDFQFNLDTDLDEETIEKLQLYPDVPLVNIYKVGGPIFQYVSKMLLIGETHASNAVCLTKSLPFTTPSSANLAFSFACYLKPKDLFLIGCDMGFKSLEESHVEGHHISDNTDDNLYKRARQMMVKANFDDTNMVQTTSFLSNTRMAIEAVIVGSNNRIRFFNLSDGARIDGTMPCHSKHLKLPAYKNKKNDIKEITECFVPAAKGVNWTPFATSGKETFGLLKNEFLKNLTLESFDWGGYSQSLNNALLKAMQRCQQEIGNDYRMAIFNKLFLDLLSVWYVYVIFRDDVKEAQVIYDVGFSNIKDILDTLEWPEGIDPN